jgi:hypothetical protein
VRASSQLVPIRPNRTFAQLLYNNGFGVADELRTLGLAWRSIFEPVRPDLNVFDHSPTALLAARGIEVRRALIGTGFFCPRDGYPLPDLRTSLSAADEKLRHDEDRVLAIAKDLLRSWNAEPLTRISQLDHEVDEHFLVTFVELDHYGARENQRYWGAWPNVGGKAPE